jgi:hypothetical protein
MDIILSAENVDLQECDAVVVGFFQDVKPLKGSSGWIDWRLNGRLSRFLIERKIRGDWKETTLIPSQGRMMSPIILLVGLGKMSEYSYLRLRELSPYFLETLKKLNVSNICFSLPFGEDTNVDCGKLAEVLLEGIADCLDLDRFPDHAEWIKGLHLFFGEGKDHFNEIFLGVQTAKSILEDRIEIRIFTPAMARMDSPRGSPNLS